MEIQQLPDLIEIQQLKARYFRLMDTRQWSEWRDLFTDGLELYMESSAVPESTTPTIVGADALVQYMQSSGMRTVHQGHMPEIEFVDADHATGIWALFDWVEDEARGVGWQGYGHYHEEYVRCPDGRWRISSIHLTRLRPASAAPPALPAAEAAAGRQQAIDALARVATRGASAG